MAIPKNRNLVSTNISASRLNIVLDAVENKRVKWIPGKSGGYGVYDFGEFFYKGARYKLDEFVEVVSSVTLVSAKPPNVQKVIKELEAELAVVVEKRDYDQAKLVNNKIESLKRILPK